MEKFNPNRATFEDGVKRVKEALKESGYEVTREIITSQDLDIFKTLNLLVTENIPNGFKKWQLPFIFNRSQLFISVASPDVEVPEHSHNEGDGIRFIISGSLFFKNKELKAGDWMYIPKETPYKIKIGNMGAMFCYCYECCCASQLLYHGPDVIKTNPFS